MPFQDTEEERQWAFHRARRSAVCREPHHWAYFSKARSMYGRKCIPRSRNADGIRAQSLRSFILAVILKHPRSCLPWTADRKRMLIAEK